MVDIEIKVLPHHNYDYCVQVNRTLNTNEDGFLFEGNHDMWIDYSSIKNIDDLIFKNGYCGANKVTFNFRNDEYCHIKTFVENIKQKLEENYKITNETGEIKFNLVDETK